MDARLIVDEPACGAWNMAVDEALLESAARTGLATLRFYAWREPTLSLGYFQGHRERDAHPASRELAWVRRSSGGGAIVHHHELTYSLALPVPGRSTASTQRLVPQVHEALVALLAELGIEAELVNRSDDNSDGVPFLCFQRHGRADVVLGKHKLLGSAQRRSRGGLLQHGSLLLAASPHALELPGVLDLAPAALEAADLARRWSRSLGQELGFSFRPGTLTAREHAAADLAQQERFANPAWNQKR